MTPKAPATGVSEKAGLYGGLVLGLSAVAALAVANSSFGPDYEALLRTTGEVRIGIVEVHADMGARRVGAAGSRQDELVVPVVVVGAVVEHDDEHGNFIFCRDPERAGIEHEIPVGLQVDDQTAGAFVRERDTQ